MLKEKIKQVDSNEIVLKIRKYEVEESLMNVKCAMAFLNDVFYNYQNMWQPNRDFFNGIAFIMDVLTQILDSAHNQHVKE